MSEAKNTPAPASAPSYRFSLVETQVVEIRDSTTRDVQPELRRPRYGIEEIFERFDELICTATFTKQSW